MGVLTLMISKARPSDHTKDASLSIVPRPAGRAGLQLHCVILQMEQVGIVPKQLEDCNEEALSMIHVKQ